MFERFDSRYDLRGRLLTKTALHIGARGSLTMVGSDNPVVRDVKGLPYIPGSGFKGPLRSLIEAIVRSLSPGERQEPWACDPLIEKKWCIQRGKVLPKGQQYSPNSDYEAIGIEDLQEGAQNDDEKLTRWLVHESCSVCRLFGSPWLASKVKVADLYLNPTNEPNTSENQKKRMQEGNPQWPGRVEVRDGVAIDRDTETVSGQRKYDFEVIPRETVFDLHLRVDNACDEELGLLFLGLREFTNGGTWVGGNTSRGLGLVYIAWDEFESIEGRAGLLDYLRSGVGKIWRGDKITTFIDEKIQAFIKTLREEGGRNVKKIT